MLRTLKYGQAEQALHLTITHVNQNSKIFGFSLCSIFCTFPSKILLLALLYSLALFSLPKIYSQTYTAEKSIPSGPKLCNKHQQTSPLSWTLQYLKMNALNVLKKTQQFPKAIIAKWNTSFLMKNLFFISNILDPRYLDHYLYFSACCSSISPHNQHPKKQHICF